MKEKILPVTAGLNSDVFSSEQSKKPEMVLLIKKHFTAFHTPLGRIHHPTGAKLKLRGETSLGLEFPQPHSYTLSHLRAFLSSWNFVSVQTRIMQHLSRMIPAGQAAT